MQNDQQNNQQQHQQNRQTTATTVAATSSPERERPPLTGATLRQRIANSGTTNHGISLTFTRLRSPDRYINISDGGRQAVVSDADAPI